MDNANETAPVAPPEVSSPPVVSVDYERARWANERRNEGVPVFLAGTYAGAVLHLRRIEHPLVRNARRKALDAWFSSHPGEKRDWQRDKVVTAECEDHVEVMVMLMAITRVEGIRWQRPGTIKPVEVTVQDQALLREVLATDPDLRDQAIKGSQRVQEADADRLEEMGKAYESTRGTTPG